MTMYYVATRTSYVLVDAESSDEARVQGRTALAELRTGAQPAVAMKGPIDIHTMRPATADEIEFWLWHQDSLAKEQQQ